MGTVNESDLDWETLERGETKFRRKRLADAAGGDDLGCSLYELPPGKKSWPYHYHTANEEAIYVLAGEGRLRGADDRGSSSPDSQARQDGRESHSDAQADQNAERSDDTGEQGSPGPRSASPREDADGETAIEAGEYAALPAGEDGAHRVVNDSDAPLRYLMISTMNEPDVGVYPDSNKFKLFVGSPPGGTDERTLSGSYRREDAVDYWAGELGGEE